MEPVAIALGSNLGDREAHLRSGVDALSGHLTDLRVSTFIESEAVGDTTQPPYLNGAAVGQWSGSPEDLLAVLLKIEARHGRQRPWPGAPRTLDLDLILFGDRIIDRQELAVPHPRFRDRAFVLLPLSRIAPEMRDPCSGLTVAELHQNLTERHL